MSEYGLNMIDLVLTYLDHHWGHPWWFDALKSIPVIHFGHFWNAWKWSLLGKLVILGHFGNDQNVSLELISVHQTIKGDPNDGLDKLKLNRSYVNHIPMLQLLRQLQSEYQFPQGRFFPLGCNRLCLVYARSNTLDLWVLSIFLCPKQSIYWSQKIL